MQVVDVSRYWPHCYHVTFLRNLASIRVCQTLLPADLLFAEAGRLELSTRRREKDVLLRIAGKDVMVRNQRALNPDTLDLGPGETLPQYVQYLNSRTYFSPGQEMIPTDSVLSLFERTLLPSVVMQIPTWSLLRMNDPRIVTISKCNSGASWLDGGKRSRRSLSSFVAPVSFVGAAAEIVEVSIEGPAQLPGDTRYSLRPRGPWLRLFPGRAAQR
jgi:hypothetical protein